MNASQEPSVPEERSGNDPTPEQIEDLTPRDDSSDDVVGGVMCRDPFEIRPGEK